MAHACGCHVETDGRQAPFCADQRVEEVGKSPAALAVLAKLGINHCCGAHLTLAEAAAAAGVSIEAVLEALSETTPARA